ncbi:MAG: UDP-N-acetylmuramoyl-L-alanyl-D-glutamate--2,6-diaminopimelate ligase [Bacteroidetes bacterium GWF2_40_14]|nr:MAG: UDP-N-acetylmuramoyl-L-alanyl-D-glutamate--2,6-diaminopimelate ligase [Bacteroidetes bacterium GWF2_40_14]
MKLSKLLNSVMVLSVSGNREVDILSVCFDSREVKDGSLFVAVKGGTSDGHDYIGKAVEAGAAAVICEVAPSFSLPVTVVCVEDSHKALGFVASSFYDNPSDKLKLVGITGTNGKTTTVTLLYQLFSGLGYKCGLLSTIANYVYDKRTEATHTTPDPIETNALLAGMAAAGCEYCFMEVSSHSLDQSRVCGLNFTGAIFSNITHDHLDYHKTFQEYIRVKKRFFDNLPPTAFALTNIDDKNGLVMLQNTLAHKYTYSCTSPADFNCRIIEKGLDGMLVRIDSREVWTRFIGEHNAYNLLSVYSSAILLGADKEEVLVQLSSLTSVSGRLEYLKGLNNLTAVVDYAHTPDALENVLKTLKDCAGESEIVAVFGCGGNRDKSKRPEMAQIAARYSDKIIVTSDNPRFEEPESIIEDIKAGFTPKECAGVLFITDRREAIKTALLMSKEGSIILVAGKGHENYQDVKGVKHHFDDKEVISEVFNQNQE